MVAGPPPGTSGFRDRGNTGPETRRGASGESPQTPLQMIEGRIEVRRHALRPQEGRGARGEEDPAQIREPGVILVHLESEPASRGGEQPDGTSPLESFRSGPVQSFEVDRVLHPVPGPDLGEIDQDHRAGAFLVADHAVGEVAGGKGDWGLVHGGMGAITQAMAASAQDKGL